MAKRNRPAKGSKQNLDIIKAIRDSGNSAISSLKEDLAAGALPSQKSKQKSPGRSVFHDDQNLQDEQDEFDAQNAGIDVKKAVEGIKRLMEQKEAEKKKGGSSGK
jgi:hypothetical protein